MKQWRGWLCALTALVVALSGWTNPISVQAAEEAWVEHQGARKLDVQQIGRYSSGADLDEGGTEIVVYDAKTKQAYSVNGAEKALDILDLSGLQSGQAMQDVPRIKRVYLEDIAGNWSAAGDITSVAKHPTEDYIAVAVVAEPKTDAGKVIFLDVHGEYLGQVEVGSLPDMVTFTPDGKKLLVANEGEPNDDLSIDPVGSVSIINIDEALTSLSNSTVNTVGFDNVDTEGLYVVRPDASFAVDAEPEYIVVSADSQTAYVVLQENSAMAVLDIESEQFSQIIDLGVKDYSMIGNELDASNKDDMINIRNWPVLGMYQPDGMAIVSIDGKSYIITANEGDSKDYDGFSEETRVEDEIEHIALQAEHYAGYSQEELDALVASGLFDEDQLGRMKITTSRGKNEEGKYEALYSYGARSFSIWSAEDLSQVYDSGSELERLLADAMPEQFNADNVENGADDRSDDKGPEPEGVTVGQIAGTTYAFVGLERAGGVAIYNIQNPEQPVFDSYINSRDFSGEEAGGDSAPEGLHFIPAAQSPTGTDLLLVAHEVTGTIAVYELLPTHEAPTDSDMKQITILHTNDTHSRRVGRYV